MNRIGFSPHQAALTAILLIGAVAAVRTPQQEINEQPPEINVEAKSNVFFTYGDTRFTDPSACELSDPTFRRALLDGMAHADPKPDFLVMTGDVVYRGDDNNDWHVFDQETKVLKDEKIRIFSVLGNHDVHGASGQSNFMEHFDELKAYPQLRIRGWYLLNYANTQFLMLDSHNSYDEHSPQGAWIRKKLKAVPEELVFLFVVLHHPVVTHASRIPSIYRCEGRRSQPVWGHDVEKEEKQLKVLLEEFSKTHRGITVVVLSGHNHNYERYISNGITYVVTAGGGATPYRISRHQSDFYNEPGPTYHYCKFVLHQGSMTGEIYKLTLEGGQLRWEPKDKFELSRPGKEAVSSTPSPRM